MAKIKISVYRNNNEEIKIELAESPNRWKDLSGSDCLESGGTGNFKIKDGNVIMQSYGASEIVLYGNPFEDAVVGNSEVSFFTNETCNGSDWKWKKL